MSTHYIPKNLKGETRILIIFSTKSLITTAIFAAIGGLLFLIFKALSLTILGVVLLIVFALLGYAVGTIAFTKNVEGDSVDEIILRYAKFKASRKVYSYTKEDE